MTRPGLYKHYKGDRYRVLHTTRWSTNGSDEGRLVVVYVSLRYGRMCARFEDEFHEEVPAPADGGFETATIPRFVYLGEPTCDDAAQRPSTNGSPVAAVDRGAVE